MLATNGVPILPLSATYCPVAIEAILRSLRLKEDKINIIQGELTRKEIINVCVPMDHSLSLCDDLLQVFVPHSIILND